ncbi:hypothetical protein H001_03237, partial [Escherichia coli UMEA 3955-1]
CQQRVKINQCWQCQQRAKINQCWQCQQRAKIRQCWQCQQRAKINQCWQCHQSIKIASDVRGTKEQKLCCVSSMEGGGTEYPETSDGKPPKPGVSRKRPDRMQCSPRPCQTLFVSGKSLCHIKEPEYRGKTEYLPPFFPSVYFFVLKFWLRKDFYDKY